MTRLTVGAPLTPLRTGVMAIAHAPARFRRIRHVAVRFFVFVFVVFLFAMVFAGPLSHRESAPSISRGFAQLTSRFCTIGG